MEKFHKLYDQFEAGLMRLGEVVKEHDQQEAQMVQAIDQAKSAQQKLDAWNACADGLDKQLEHLDKVAAWIGDQNEKLCAAFFDG